MFRISMIPFLATMPSGLPKHVSRLDYTCCWVSKMFLTHFLYCVGVVRREPLRERGVHLWGEDSTIHLPRISRMVNLSLLYCILKAQCKTLVTTYEINVDKILQFCTKSSIYLSTILGTVLNRSLTNIQWLKGMQLKEDKPQTTQNQLASQYQNVQWTSLTPSEIMKVGGFNTKIKLWLQSELNVFQYMSYL